jgi:integrase
VSVYDNNSKRIAEIRRDIAAGRTTAEKGGRRIATLKARGPEYWVKGRAFGKWYDLPCPEPGIKAARAYDARIKLQVVDRTYTPAELLKTRLRDIFKAHLDAQKGGGRKAAATRCGHASRIFGHVRLEKLHENPVAILEPGFDALPTEWKQKTRWHVWSFMKAAIERFKAANPKIQINNPMTAYPMEHGTEDREVFPTEAEHLRVLAHLKANPLRWVTRPGKGPTKAGFPAYLHALMVCKYEQGLRGMEIIPWRFERADMDCMQGKYPAIETKILKKGKRNWQWVVLTPTAYKALRAYLDTVPGPKERGPIWPVRNWPTDLVRRLLDECELPHLWAHDWRRAWTMKHIEAPGERRRAAIGKETDAGEAPYKVFNRREQEAFYAPLWADSGTEIPADK